MTPYYSEAGIELYHGDCRAVLPALPENRFDTCITDPPYHLTANKKGGTGPATMNLDSPAGRSRIGTGFMGKAWDGGDVAFQPATWEAVLRVCKPGAILLAFGGPRTFHRLTCAIEDGGWEIRDCMSWLYGSGFPKSLDISKAIDKAAGEVRKLGKPKVSPDGTVAHGRGWSDDPRPWQSDPLAFDRMCRTSLPATAAAAEWNGWGTALKPAWESLIVARKPLPTDSARDIIVENLLRLEAQLWSILPASIAESVFRLSPAECERVRDSVHKNAAPPNCTWADLFGQMDTSLSVSAMITSLNTVRSWRNTLAENSAPTSTSTTATKTSPTIDWATLKSCALALTPSCIIAGAMSERGLASSASTAARYFSAVVDSIRCTRELSVIESAIEQGRVSHPDAIDPHINWRPIIVAMKPLDGTFAENAQKWGVAGLNIDGGRIEGAPDPASWTAKRDPNAGHGHIGQKRKNIEAMNAGLIAPPSGRFPANVILDEEAARQLDEASGELTSGEMKGGDASRRAGPRGKRLLRNLWRKRHRCRHLRRSRRRIALLLHRQSLPIRSRPRQHASHRQAYGPAQVSVQSDGDANGRGDHRPLRRQHDDAGCRARGLPPRHRD